MTSLERKYTLFSPASCGGEKRICELRAVVSRLGTEECDEGGAKSSRVSATACVRCECAPKGGFVRGMRLARGELSYRVLSAVRCSRLWMLRLERTVMEGEV